MSRTYSSRLFDNVCHIVICTSEMTFDIGAADGMNAENYFDAVSFSFLISLTRRKRNRPFVGRLSDVLLFGLFHLCLLFERKSFEIEQS